MSGVELQFDHSAKLYTIYQLLIRDNTIGFKSLEKIPQEGYILVPQFKGKRCDSLYSKKSISYHYVAKTCICKTISCVANSNARF